MKPGIYLEEALKDMLRTSNFVHGLFNLITAPCGSGKTTAAINVISKLASLPRTALFLIDTKNGNQRLAREKALTMPYAFYEENYAKTHFASAEFDPNKIVVTTYAQFGVWAYHNPNFHSFFDVIICDEAHNIITFPNYGPQPNYATIARDSLYEAVWNCDTLVVGLTATPGELRKLNCDIHQILIDVSRLRQYENKKVITYSSLPQLLEQLPNSQRGALYVTHINKMKEYEQLAIKAGMHPICIWSTSNKKQMTEEQYAARAYILEHECVPPQYDLFIFNKSCETSINLCGHLDYMIIQSTQADTITQARGRYRDDLEVLYCFDSAAEQDVIIPAEYLDVYIYKEDKQKLRTQIGIKDSKGHLLPYDQLFLLVESCGYRLEHGRKSNRPYIIIREL